MTAAQLKTRLKAAHERHGEHSRIRLHRAISWLARAEREKDDPDARFIFLWIAFNAAYAKQFGFESTERETLQTFINTLVKIDSNKQLNAAVFNQFTGPIRVLIGNKFVFEPFWKALRDHDSSERWKDQFENSNQRAFGAVMGSRTEVVLAIVFERLYVLRNQLVHGGATWNSKVNRAQVSDGTRILGTLVPLIIELMVGHPELDFGENLYPVVTAV
jgi:Apea-like HEPN